MPTDLNGMLLLPFLLMALFLFPVAARRRGKSAADGVFILDDRLSQARHLAFHVFADVRTNPGISLPFDRDDFRLEPVAGAHAWERNQ